MILIVHQPRQPGATDADAVEAGNTFAALLRKAGFENIEIHKKTTKPVSIIAVKGSLK
jgi:aldehyde:ferredoxin oxidoreductase